MLRKLQQLLILIAVVGVASAQIPTQAFFGTTRLITPTPTFSYAVSWLGSTFAGGSITPGKPLTGYWVPDFAWGGFVMPDGTLFTNGNWDESGGELCIYKNGTPIINTISFGVPTCGFQGMHVGGQYTTSGVAADGTTVWATSGANVGRWDINTRYFSGVGGLVNVAASGVLWGMAQRTAVSELYVSAPGDNKIYVLNSGNLAAVRNFAFTAPGSIAVDGAGVLWIARTSDHTIRKYSRTGTDLGISITLPNSGIPLSLAYDATGNRLMVGDSGPNQQIVFYNNLAGTPALSGTFGTTGGIYSGTSGLISPLKLIAPVGIGTDSGGNIYTVSNLGGVDAKKFTSGGTLVWEMTGQLFVDGTQADPASDAVDIYGIRDHYSMDYSQSNGGEWSWKGMTINPMLYPTDFRISGAQASGFGYLQFTRRINGVLFLALTDQYGSYLMACQVQGEICKPSFIFMPLDKTTGSGWNVPGLPVGQSWLWRDSNGNGNVSSAEVYDIGGEQTGLMGWDIDADGNVWQAFPNGTVRKYVRQGMDGFNNPVYNVAHIVDTTAPVYQGSPIGGGTVELLRIKYDSAADVMYLSGYTPLLTNHSLDPSGKGAGTVFTRYTNWSGGNRTPDTSIVMPYYDPANYGNVSTWDVAGHKVFFGVQGSSGPDQTFTVPPHNVFVFDTISGAADGVMIPNGNVGNQMGFEDGTFVLHAEQRSNGEYIITEEEVVWDKNIMYRLIDTF